MVGVFQFILVRLDMIPRRQTQLQRLVQKLGLDNQKNINWSLLDLALTHPSISKEANYEQLEFVGDSVVRLAAAELLWETYPNATVGEFAAIRSILVSDLFLAELAESFGLERYILSSPSVEGDKAGRISRLADSFEAVLGALYLSDYSIKPIRLWLDPLLKEKAEKIRLDPARYNYKDALQEWTQSQHKILPEYRVQENPASTTQEDRFEAQVWLNGVCLGKGLGRTKKASEQAAAKQAFLAVRKQFRAQNYSM